MLPQQELDHKVLNDKEIRELFKRCKCNDNKAREKLILYNMKLVIYVAKKFENKGAEIDDLINIGAIGLIKAIDSFNLDKNVKFATYSVRCIENEILFYLRKVRKRLREISINTLLNEDDIGHALSIENTLVDDNPIAEELATKEVDIMILRQIVNQLPLKKQQIIKMYFGFDDVIHNQNEIANIFGTSQPYISKVINSTLNHIKQKYLEYI